MERLKFNNTAPDLCPSSRRISGSILKYVAIDATKKTGKKTSHVVNFIIFMALILDNPVFTKFVQIQGGNNFEPDEYTTYFED